MFVESQALYGMKGPVPEGEYLVPLGVADVKRAGTDITLVAWGPLVHDCLKAADKLKAERGVSAEVIDLRSLVPLDMETVLRSVQKTGRCVVASQAIHIGSYTGEIASTIQDEAFDYLDAPVKRVGAKNGIAPQVAHPRSGVPAERQRHPRRRQPDTLIAAKERKEHKRIMSGKIPKRKPRPGVDEYGRSDLHLAVINKDLAVVQRCISAKMFVDAQDDNGWTPLHFAAQDTSFEIAEALVKAGANPNMPDSYGNTPLWRAVFCSKETDDRLVKLLRSVGADPKLNNKSNVSPFSLAQTMGKQSLLFSDITVN